MHATPADHALGAVEGIARAVGGAARAVRRLAVAAAVAAVVIGVYVFRDGWLDDVREWVIAALLLALAAAPPVVLYLFSEALRALAELPARLRSAPAQALERADDLSRLGAELRAGRGARVPSLLWRLTKLAGSSRELLTPHAAVLPLASIPFLLLSAAAIAAAVLELVVATALLVVLAF